LGGKGNVLESPLSTSTNTRTPSTKGSAGSTVRSINRSGVRSQGSDTSPGDADVLEVSTDVLGVRTDVIKVGTDFMNEIVDQILSAVLLVSLSYNSFYHACSPVSTSKHPLSVREARCSAFLPCRSCNAFLTDTYLPTALLIRGYHGVSVRQDLRP
jgi:hypothetical protein